MLVSTRLTLLQPLLRLRLRRAPGLGLGLRFPQFLTAPASVPVRWFSKSASTGEAAAPPVAAGAAGGSDGNGRGNAASSPLSVWIPTGWQVEVEWAQLNLARLKKAREEEEEQARRLAEEQEKGKGKEDEDDAQEGEGKVVGK